MSAMLHLLPPACRLLLPALFVLVAHGTLPGQSAILWKPQDPPRGSIWREETRIEISGMKIKIGSGGQETDAAGSFQFMETFERKHTGNGRVDAQVMASTIQGTLAILGNQVDQLQGGALLGKKLLGRRERNNWQFVFKDVKPTPEEQKELDALGSRMDLLALWPYLYGTQARRKGETWKADTSFLTKETKGTVPVTADITFTFVDVEERAGARCAKLSVNGFFKISGGPKNPASITLEVQGDIWRDPREMVDVESNLQGMLKISGAPAKDPKLPEGSTLEISAPFVLKRGVKATK